MSTFNVLLLDGIDPAGVKLLEQTNAIIPIVHDKIAREKLLDLVPEADGIIVRSGTMIDKELIQKATRLRVVGRAGVGVDNVDIDAATERGILVMNSPGGSTTTTAEHAIAMLFALARSIPQAYLSLKNGKWEKSRFKGLRLRVRRLVSSAWVVSAAKSHASARPWGCTFSLSIRSSIPIRRFPAALSL
jgi:D-3-phosphoglycerate dehydrogenase